jgi:hypothetical protein
VGSDQPTTLAISVGPAPVAASGTIRTRRARRCSHHRASRTHPALQEITIRWRGGFGYLSAWAGEGDDNDEEIRLCRIEYLGGDAWAFALYDPTTEGYDPAALVTGSRIGSPTEAYDTAAIVHLTDYQK